MNYILLLVLANRVWGFVVACLVSVKLLSVCRVVLQNSIFQRLWLLFSVGVIYDFFWYGCAMYNTSYRLWISATPQFGYLLVSSCLLLLWPLAIFLYTLRSEWLIAAEDKFYKRHYFFGAWTAGLMVYFLYDLFTYVYNPANPWKILSTSSFVMMNVFIIANSLGVITYGMKKLLAGKSVPLIIQQQIKWIVCFVGMPIILQSIFLLENCGVYAATGIYWELFISLLQDTLIFGSYYVLLRLFDLRLFNAIPMVKGKPSPRFGEVFDQTVAWLNRTITLPEIRTVAKTYFEKAFDFKQSGVTLYIRPVDYEGVIDGAPPANTHPKVEALFFSSALESVALCKKIREKVILLHANVQYEETYHIGTEAKRFRAFLEELNAEGFIPIYREQSLVAYIIIEHNACGGMLIHDVEVQAMLTFITHLAYVIESRQRLDSKVLVKKCMEHVYRERQLYQEREHCHEGMQTMAKHIQTTGAVSLICLKNNRLQVADSEGAALLGLPKGTLLVPDRYKEPLKRLINGYKNYGRSEPIFQKDPQGKMLRFTPLRSPYKRNILVAVSHQTLTDSLSFPSFVNGNSDTWNYTLFLQTTASGKQLNAFVPINEGFFLNFKITYMRAVFARRPVCLLGYPEDIKQLAVIAQAMWARDTFESLGLVTEEQGNECAVKLFGITPIKEGEEDKKGLLATLSASGTLFIERIECLSLKTQELLAEFIATGSYTPLCSRQFTSSDVQIICGCHLNERDLKSRVEAGMFSTALYHELKKSSVTIPQLSQFPSQMVAELIRPFCIQLFGEEVLQLHAVEIDQLISDFSCLTRVRSLSELRLYVKTKFEMKLKQKGHFKPAVLVNGKFHDEQAVLQEAQRLGRKTLKDKKLFTAVVTLIDSCAGVAKLLGVAYSTVQRKCEKYEIGNFAPGYERKPGRPRKRPSSPPSFS